jgi:hypothetical protein
LLEAALPPLFSRPIPPSLTLLTRPPPPLRQGKFTRRGQATPSVPSEYVYQTGPGLSALPTLFSTSRQILPPHSSCLRSFFFSSLSSPPQPRPPPPARQGMSTRRGQDTVPCCSSPPLTRPPPPSRQGVFTRRNQDAVPCCSFLQSPPFVLYILLLVLSPSGFSLFIRFR